MMNDIIMKPQQFLSIFLCAQLLFLNCKSQQKNKEDVGNISKEKTSATPSLHYDKYAAVYQFSSTHNDSILVCEQWFLNDSLVKKTGKFYSSFPLQSEYVDDETVKSANGRITYETFDPLMCEVGGSSAWNKYVFIYDDKKQPLLVEHFKAYFENYDANGNVFTNKTPDYHLGEVATFVYNANGVIQTLKNAEGKLIEQITKRGDNKGRLVFEERDDADGKRTRVYYQYKD